MSMDRFRLDGRVALVTGASGALGAEFARVLSGVGHLAASVGAPTLAIYSASHQPQEWGPRGPRSQALMAVVPCSPCGYDRLAECPYEHTCMQGLLPESVFAQAAKRLMA